MSQMNQYLFRDTMRGIIPDVGGEVDPNPLDGTITLAGGTLTTTTGNPGTYTITIDVGAGVASSFLTDDANSAVPALNVLTVAGGTNIGTTSGGSTVTINLDDTVTLSTVNATTLDTNIAAAGVTLAGTSLIADGTDVNIDINITPQGTGAVVTTDIDAANIVANGVVVGTVAAGVGISGTTLEALGTDANVDINITAQGTGQVIIDDLQLTTDLTVPYGGTGASTFTDGGVLVGAAAGPIEALTVGTNGQVLVGSGAANPVFATLGSSDSTIGYTAGAGTLTLQCTDATTIQDGVVELATDAESIAGTDSVRAIVPTSLKAKLGTQTDHGLLVGAGTTTAITALAVGTTNQVLLGSTGADPTWGAVDLTTDVTGLLPIANGGTNANTMATTYGVNYFDGAKLVTTTVGTATHVLTSNGAGVAPTFQVTSAAAGVSTVSGGTNISTSGTAADPIVDLDATITLTTVNATTFDTNVAAAAVTLTGTTLAADGTDPNININITAKGTGQVIIDDLQLTTDLTVPYGGTGAGTFTDGGVLVGATAGPIEALAVGTNGQVLVGSGAANPVFATLGSSDSTIGYTTGAGTLTLQCRDATTGVDGVVELTTDAEATAGTDTSRAVTAAALKAKIGSQTSHGLPYGAGTTTAIAWTAEPTHGQLLMGDTGNIPQLGTLTAGTGITITNAAHSVTVASTGTTLNNQVGTTYTLIAGDIGKLITLNNAAAVTLTVPAEATTNFAIGSIFLLQALGAGQVTISPAGGVTLRSADDAYKLVKQYSCATLIKIAAETFLVAGDVEA